MKRWTPQTRESQVELVHTMSMLWLSYWELPTPKPFTRGTWYDRMRSPSDLIWERVLDDYQDLIPERVDQIRRYLVDDRSVEKDGIFLPCEITYEQLEAVQDRLRKISPESWTQNKTN